MDNILYPIALTCIKGIGPMLAKRLIEHLGSAERIFREKRGMLERTPGIGQTLAEAIIRQRDEALLRAGEELEFIRRYGIRTYYIDDANYPTRLKQCQDAPLVLFAKGETNLNAAHFIGIVGTRRPTEQGRNNCHKLVADIAQALPGTVIVSGLAYGIDVCAHQAALQAGLPTVGVLAHGLDRLYPPPHRPIAAEMVKHGGGLLTEYPSRTNPDRPNFVQRNRIVAGLCDALVVVESAHRGGALITAKLAFDYDREVFTFPGRVSDEYSAGCHELIKSNVAALIESADDLLRYIDQPVNKGKAQPKEPTLFDQQPSNDLPANLPEEDRRLLLTLRDNPDGLLVNDLVEPTGQPFSQLSIRLLELEMRGLVKRLPGNVYKAV